MTSQSSQPSRTNSRKVSSLTLTVLGTASAVPVAGRIQSAHVLDVHGRLFLIDCGEGTQSRMIECGVSIMKIDSICISHTHGDHIFGLNGLLSTMAMKGRQAPLDIYGPSSLGPELNFFHSFHGEGLPYEIRFHKLSMKAPEVIYEAKSFIITAFPLNHKIDTFGYLFKEKEPQMNVKKEALEKYGFTLAEIGALKAGEDVIRPAGEDTGATFMNGFVRHSGTDKPLIIKNSEAAYKPYDPCSYAYVSDTAPFPELTEWVRGVTVLYHESTYLECYAEQAALRFHSTAKQAAKCALEAGAGRLILGHYSSRVQDPVRYEEEAKTIFPETTAANDGDVFPI